VKADQTITIRRPKLAFPARLDPVLLEGQPELSYALIALSLTLPYVEPWLIRTMSLAKHQVTDPELVEEMLKFNGQEGQHHRLHSRFNKAVRESCPELEALEEELAADFRRFTTTRSLKWNLAYAEGFEAFTGALARFMFEEQLLRGAEPAVRDLFEWHMVEELEHRCVAFDVYEHLYGGYAYRLAVGLYAQWHLARFVLRATRLMLERDRARGIEHGGKAAARGRLRPFFKRVARRLLPKVLATYSPWYSPHRIAMPPEAALALQRIEETGAPAPVKIAAPIEEPAPRGGPPDREQVAVPVELLAPVDSGRFAAVASSDLS
jgi:predicted metal-dependent hydrolase